MPELFGAIAVAICHLGLMGNVVPSLIVQAESEEWENLEAKFHFHAGFQQFLLSLTQKRKQSLTSSEQSKLIPSHTESDGCQPHEIGFAGAAVPRLVCLGSAGWWGKG